MPTKRLTGAAADNRIGWSAGTIASSSGKASVTPAPRRNVRRGMCFFGRNISNSQLSYVLIRTGRLLVRLHPHLELITRDDCLHDGGEPIVILGDLLRDRTDRRHVRVFH